MRLPTASAPTAEAYPGQQGGNRQICCAGDVRSGGLGKCGASPHGFRRLQQAPGAVSAAVSRDVGNWRDMMGVGIALVRFERETEESRPKRLNCSLCLT